MLTFKTGDDTTDFNLQRLEGLSDPRHLHDDVGVMQNWLEAVISSLEMLPDNVRQKIRVNPYLGDSHYRMSVERRRARWSKLLEDLSEGLSQVAGEPTISTVASDRPQSLGEAITALCDELLEEGHGSEHFNTLVYRLNHLATNQARTDAREIVRLSKLKHVDNGELHRVVHHLKLVASQMHGISAR